MWINELKEQKREAQLRTKTAYEAAWRAKGKAKKAKEYERQEICGIIAKAAEHGNIAINRHIADAIIRRQTYSNNKAVRDDKLIKDLENYISLCRAYKEIQKGFDSFYHSASFKSICTMYANRELDHEIPRLANSDFRGYFGDDLSDLSGYAIRSLEKISK